jgi:hypothetical protein
MVLEYGGTLNGRLNESAIPFTTLTDSQAVVAWLGFRVKTLGKYGAGTGDCLRFYFRLLTSSQEDYLELYLYLYRSSTNTFKVNTYIKQYVGGSLGYNSGGSTSAALSFNEWFWWRPTAKTRTNASYYNAGQSYVWAEQHLTTTVGAKYYNGLSRQSYNGLELYVEGRSGKVSSPIESGEIFELELTPVMWASAKYVYNDPKALTMRSELANWFEPKHLYMDFEAVSHFDQDYFDESQDHVYQNVTDIKSDVTTVKSDVSTTKANVNSLIGSHPGGGVTYSPVVDSPVYVNPVSGTMGDDLKSSFDSLALLLDGAMTFNPPALTLPWPFDGVASVINDIMEVLTEGFELLTDIPISLFISLVKSLSNLIDDIGQAINSQGARFSGWIGSQLSFSVSSWYEVGAKISDIINDFSSDMGFSAGFKEPLIGLDIGTSWGLLSTSFKIPRMITVTFFGMNVNFGLLELPFFMVPGPYRRMMVPTSDQWPGRTATSGNIPTFITSHTGKGVPMIDFIGALVVYSLTIVGAGVLAQYAPKASLSLLKSLLGFLPTKPTNQDILLALHPQASYSSTWELNNPADTIAQKVDAIPTNPLLATDTRLAHLDSDISSIPTNPLLTNDSRLNHLNADIGNIPTNPLLDDDIRLDHLDADVGNIPTNPLLSSDVRLNHLDADISDIPTNPLLNDDIRLNHLNADVGDIPTDPLLSNDIRLNHINADIGDIPTNPLLNDDIRLNHLDADVGNIPTNPLLSDDIRLNHLNADIGDIPTNPLLSDDIRLNNIDSKISDIPINPVLLTDSRLDRLDANVSSSISSIRKAYKRMYGMTKFSMKHKKDLNLFWPLISAIAITDIDIMSPLIDSAIDADDTTDEEYDAIMELKSLHDANPDLAGIARLLARYYR